MSIDIPGLKEKLVTCIRLMAMEGLLDFNGHVSLRLPDDRLLINSRYSTRAGITPEQIVIADMDGNLLEGDDEPPSETVIHTEIYQARPDVGAVAHLHPQYATLFTIAGIPLVPVYIVASLFGKEGVPVFDDSSLIRSKEQGRAVAKALGNRPALLLRAHGAVAVAPDIEGVFAVAFALEDNARKALWAAMLGGANSLSEAEMGQYGAPVSHRGTRHKIWNFHVEKARARGWL
ncbi:MAG: class II aldolase/adducin family protein [Chloroflexi bacterium]|nr:MAG: class II aldolase/adducin family protein [Chloroflexota bacterium]